MWEVANHWNATTKRFLERGHFPSVEAWRFCESFLNESLNISCWIKWNVIWTPFWALFEMDKSCVPVAKLALSDKKYSHCNFHCWVLPGIGLFHQQFLKTSFDFRSMWQLRIWYLDTDALSATNELIFNMLLRAWMHGEKKSELQKGNLKRFSIIHVADSQFLVPNQIFLWKNTPLSSISISKTSKVSTGYMASSTKKCDSHATSSFCVAFGSFGFFLTSTFPPLKHHPPCIGAFGKTSRNPLSAAVFFESTPSA